MSGRVGPAVWAVTMMAAALAMGVALLAAPGAWADDPPSPGPNPLQLQVGRLEHSSQSKARGDAASSMLFNPVDDKSLAAAGRLTEEKLAGQVGQLFVTKANGLSPVASVAQLFAPGAYQAPAGANGTGIAPLSAGSAGPGAIPEVGAGPLGGQAWVLAAGGGLLLVAGGTLASTRAAQSGKREE